jgi:hypothetical protein
VLGFSAVRVPVIQQRGVTSKLNYSTAAHSGNTKTTEQYLSNGQQLLSHNTNTRTELRTQQKTPSLTQLQSEHCRCGQRSQHRARRPPPCAYRS